MRQTPTICINGHIISRTMPDAAPFCPQCGAPTLSKCAECGNLIPPLPSNHLNAKRPNYCAHCGAAYPWTKLLLENAVELVALDDELDADSKELIKSAIPGLITDSPVTPLAAAKYRKGIAQAGDFLKNALYDLLKDVMVEQAKRALGL